MHGKGQAGQIENDTPRLEEDGAFNKVPLAPDGFRR